MVKSSSKGISLEAVKTLPPEYVVDIEIQGRPPGLLMHSAKSMLTSAMRPGAKMCSHDRPLSAVCNDCLEVSAYRLENGALYIPSEAIHGASLVASGAVQISKYRSLSSLFAGGVRVQPYYVPLLSLSGVPLVKYDVDTRPVVIKGMGRVIRHRPWVKEWKAEFQMVILREIYVMGLGLSELEQVLVNAGLRVGVLDFRPAKKGAFGTFIVTKFKVANGI